MRPIRLVVPLGLAAIAGCAGSRPSVVAVPAIPFVSLERATDTTWRATWHLAAPASELRFERPADGFRRESFTVLTPGFSFARDGDTEVLRTGGAPASTIAVEFPVRHRELPREYEFVRRFTDGSIALYTGHLVARAAGGGTAACDTCWIRRLHVVPPEGARIVIGGREHGAPVSWADGTGQGTFVFIGRIAPVESPAVVAITDPGLPPWIAGRWSRTLAELFALFQERLGVGPATRPTVLFDYRRSDVAGHDYTGGVLPGVIQLGVEGQAWEQESPAALQRVVRFLAHEAAHVWNGGIVTGPAPADPWMHEGGAEALADRALLALGLIDEAQLLASQSAALNACRAGIGARAVRAVSASATLPYACGNVLALLTEAALPRGADLFDLWREIIATARAGGGRYDYDTYLAAWRTLGAREEDVRRFARLVEESAHPDSLVAALTAHGVRVVSDTAPPPDYAGALGREALRALMAEDCGGRVSFRQVAGGFRTASDLRCTTLPAGALVTAIGGHDLATAGHHAWRRLVERCGSEAALDVRLADPDGAGDGQRTVELRCRKAVPPRPAYVRITRIVR